MIAGHLEKKAGKYYCVLSFKNTEGKRERKWISTGLSVKGNKKRAEQKLSELRRTFKPPVSKDDLNSKMPLVDYLRAWLKIVKKRVSISTYHHYYEVVNQNIIPYFSNMDLNLDDTTRNHVQDFVNSYIYKGKYKSTTIKNYYTVLRIAFLYAEKTELINRTPCKHIEIYSSCDSENSDTEKKFYTNEEINQLLQILKGNRYEVPVILAAFLGLRRGEALGLKWSAIDFDKKTITIKHSIKCKYSEDNESKIVGVIGENKLKTEKSARVLPLMSSLEKTLKEIRESQEYNKKVCGKSYNYEYEEYVCVDKLGKLISPNSLTVGYKYHVEKSCLPYVCFHGLRHSCASLLLNNGYDLKTIQEFLGHSNYNITANLYAHVDKKKIIKAGDTIDDLLIAPDIAIKSNWG